jgi:hypothetical protein
MATASTCDMSCRREVKLTERFLSRSKPPESGSVLALPL